MFRLLGGGGRFFVVWTWLTFLAIAGLVGYYFYEPSAWASGGRLYEYRYALLAIPGLLALLALLAWILVLRGGASDGGGRLDDGILTIVAARLLHLEPQGPQLRRLDPGPALALLADPVLAPAPAPGVEDGQAQAWLATCRCWPC